MTEVPEQVENALLSARSSLIAFGGDPRELHRKTDGRFGDAIQCAVLDDIDTALAMIKVHAA